jgi:transposase
VDRRKGAPNLAEGIMVFLGIDVSKDRLDCALLATAGVKVLGGRSFPNDAAGIEKIVAWTEWVTGVAPAEVHGVLEATAAYHELAAHRLAAAGLRMSIVNSARVRSFGKGLGILGKTDPIDARLLARYGQLASPRAWRAPAKRFCQASRHRARLGHPGSNG